MMTESNEGQDLSIDIKEEEANGSNQTSLGNRDLEKIVSSVKKELRQKSPLPDVACIFRVPEILRRANNDNKIFEPELVSFGPFHHPLHHEKPQLQKMEEIKYWYLQCLLDRKPTVDTTLECLVQAIGDIEQECRACYAEEIPFDKEEFVKMMVVDGCFIIEFFRYLRGSEKFIDKDDPIFNSSWMIPQILTESLLLENQLPWRVLTLLFDKTATPRANELDHSSSSGRSSHPQHDALTLLVATSYEGLVPSMELQPDNNLKDKHKHLLDFLRNCLLGSYVYKEDVKETLPWIDHIPPVTDLLQAGVKFRIKENKVNIGILQAPRSIWQRLFSRFGTLLSSPRVDVESPGLMEEEISLSAPLMDAESPGLTEEEISLSAPLMHITFNKKDGVMEIPPIYVCENTETLFRNLIAFEQCYKDGDKNEIASYIVLWDNLINNSKDVDFLVKNKIVHVIHCLSTEHTASVFSRLADNAGFNNFLYKKLFKDVIEWQEKRWNIWRATLISDYFNNPWAIMSVFAAIVILIFTFLQTLYTVLSYY